jgi:hypothetical protein
VGPVVVPALLAALPMTGTLFISMIPVPVALAIGGFIVELKSLFPFDSLP